MKDEEVDPVAVTLVVRVSDLLGLPFIEDEKEELVVPVAVGEAELIDE